MNWYVTDFEYASNPCACVVSKEQDPHGRRLDVRGPCIYPTTLLFGGLNQVEVHHVAVTPRNVLDQATPAAVVTPKTDLDPQVGRDAVETTGAMTEVQVFDNVVVTPQLGDGLPATVRHQPTTGQELTTHRRAGPVLQHPPASVE